LSVVWWDKTHKKSTIGGLGHTSANRHYAVPKEKFRKLDLLNGTYNETKIVDTLQVKYEKEVRMCLGVAVVKRINGTLEGVNATPFNIHQKVEEHVLMTLEMDTKDAEKLHSCKRMVCMQKECYKHVRRPSELFPRMF
jgi:hypothetical protein